MISVISEAKQRVHTDIKTEITGTEKSKGGEHGRRIRVEKSPIEYNAHYCRWVH